MPVPQNWFGASAEAILGNIWLANPMKVALMKPTYVPNRDTQKVFADIAAQELAAGGGYTVGGITLTGKTADYDPASDTTHLFAVDVLWGPGATFDTAFAVVYDNSGAKPLWGLIDFQAVKSVGNGVFQLDFDTLGLLDILAA
jgi:hypothetical protein